jgi:hypothetical protein
MSKLRYVILKTYCSYLIKWFRLDLANVGEVNSSPGVHTTHVDTRYCFAFHHIVDAFIKIIFVKSCNKGNVLFTKNIYNDAYKKLASNFLDKIEDSYN